ncbi:DUF2911 domain-containing protein [Lacinutrix iliipiscaria]|uniref:DUF2911 domain-containing protein n=1 Tax=Lacinutrix iliipiscaria TaxID=1230532 RepID=A0ABW5WQ12_9FLAO
MKKLLLIALVFTFSYQVNAQVETPQASPLSKLEQKVGLTDITVEYSRPGVKGRTIFGGLESFGTTWRTGANKNTMITFSTETTVSGTPLKAGSYAIFTKLNSAKQWDVIFYTDTNNWGVPKEWDESKVAATVSVDVMEIPFNVETFTIDINGITDNGARIEMIWEKSYVAIPFSVPTDKYVTASIDKIMNGPGAADYYSSAAYYLQADKDISKAKMWIDKAIEMTKDEPRYWYLRQQSLIYAKSGDTKGAIAIAKESLRLAKENNNTNYVKMNEASIAEWSN